MMSSAVKGQLTSLMTLLLPLVSLLCLPLPAKAKTVVFLSVPHIANVRTFTNAGRALAARGHDVWVPVTHEMLKENVVNTEGVKVIPFGKNLGNFDRDVNTQMISKVWNNETMGLGDVVWALSYSHKLIIDMLGDQELVGKLKQIKPDLFVLQNAPPLRNMVVFPYMLNSPFAYITPFNDYIGQRSPFMLASSPNQLNEDFLEKGMPFFGRLKNSLMNLGLLVMHAYVTSDAAVAEFAPNRPRIDTDKIMTQAEIFLIESDPIMDFGRPELPNTKFIGSMAGTPPKTLKEPFKSFVENSKNGVVLVTFGSIVKEFPDYISSKLVAALMSLDQRVVWRAANVKSPDSSRLLTSSWVPQNEILAHKNTKLFVSHCGANGQYESLYHAVPTLCLPLSGDQNYNAQRGKVKGFGLKEDIRYATSKELAALMREIIENNKYKEKVTQASFLYKKLYKLPVNESAFWLDHVMTYGASHMRSAGQYMTVGQFLGLDILAFLVVVKLVVILVLWFTCRLCCRLCRGKSDKFKSE